MTISVRVEGKDESEDPIAGGKRAFINKKTKQTNKNYPVGEKTDWLASRQGRAGQGWAGQGWTGHRRHLTLGNEPTRNCKHKEIIKGANDEGNEGKQLGKINQ